MKLTNSSQVLLCQVHGRNAQAKPIAKKMSRAGIAADTVLMAQNCVSMMIC